MAGVSPEDVNAITHITHVSDSIHDFATDLYEHLMERENEEAKQKAQELMKVLADLIQSLSDDI
jgi:hypothetical protein